jgi:antitoxin component YwqK of YwqJK toxin-antitoxin module
MRGYLIVVALFYLGIGCNNVEKRTVDPMSEKAVFDISEYEIEEFGDGVQRARKRFKDGSLVEEGMLLNGERNGSWTIFHPNGKPHVVNSYLNGRKNGLTIEFDEFGRVRKEANFINDQFDGRYKEFVVYIPVRDTEYKNGKFHGLHKEFDHNGVLQKDMMFKEGVQHGPLNYYNSKGDVTVTYMYEDGEKISGGMK